MEFIQVPTTIRRQNLSTLWTLADNWFRLLEFALVLGVFYVAKERTHNVVIAAVYWLSSGVLLMWFEELGEFAAAALGIARRSPFQRSIIWAMAMFAALAVYMVTTQAANAILALK
jgi:hypothetical protein